MRPDSLSKRLSLTNISEAPLAAKYRGLLAAAVAATAVTVSACGPGDNGNNGNDAGAGAAGTAGSAGTGNVDAGGNGGTGGMDGGMGGEAGSDPCQNLEFDGLGSKVYEVNQTGAFTIQGLQGVDAVYNGMTLDVKDGAVFAQRTRLGLRRVVFDNYPLGYNVVGDLQAVRVFSIDGNQAQEDDGNGGCRDKLVALNDAILADPLKQPVLSTPSGYFVTGFRVLNSSQQSTADYELQTQNTDIRLSSFTVPGMTTDYAMGNSLPAGADPILAIRPDGKLEVNATSVTDEGNNSELVLNNLKPSAPGVTFEPVLGQSGMYRSTAPFVGTTLNFSWSGLNQNLTNDTVTKLLNVEQLPNNPPTINSLLANPNPCNTYDFTTLNFNVNDSDNDNVNWSLTIEDIPGGVDALVNPSNGSCNGLTCSGTLPNGGGNVSITYNTGSAANPTMTLDVDDGKGGTDQDQEVVTVL